MNAREFYFRVKEMRHLQRIYFETHDRLILKACFVVEKDIDQEIERVDSILAEQEKGDPHTRAAFLAKI